MAATTTEKIKLFVYGTLKRGQIRNRCLKDSKFLREVVTKPEYHLLNLGQFPGIVRVEKDGRSIVGELYEITVELRPYLDSIEGSPTLFNLEEINIEGETDVYAYFLKRRVSNPNVIESNVW
jgi:gamma-glutamylcyclotransferase (GGCT)/AIG2-like uncharacterized protein YtfP